MNLTMVTYTPGRIGLGNMTTYSNHFFLCELIGILV